MASISKSAQNINGNNIYCIEAGCLVTLPKNLIYIFNINYKENILD